MRLRRTQAHENYRTGFQPLFSFPDVFLGRCPRLIYFAPLALFYAFWRAKGPVPYQPGATPQEKRAKRSGGLKARSIPDPLHAIFGTVFHARGAPKRMKRSIAPIGISWERGRLVRRIWPITTAPRNKRAFAASAALLLIARFLNTTAGEDARAPSEPLFSEQ
jgi:hypothetical protein